MAVEEAMMSTMGPYFAFLGIGLVLIILSLILIYFVAWLWMIIDCARRNKFKNGDRVMWILLLVLVPLIGTILYYFMEMRD